MVEVFFIMALTQPLTHYPLSLSFFSSLFDKLFGVMGLERMIYVPDVLPPSLLVQWFCFRFMLAAGLMKWFGSEKWKNLTAMNDHYFTQPLPTPLSFYIHNLVPPFIHKFSVMLTLMVELVFPFVGLFGWGWGKVVVWVSYTTLMIGINMAGNYGHLGLVTSVACFSLIPPSLLPALFSLFPPFPIPLSFPLSVPSLPLPLSLSSIFDDYLHPYVGVALGVCCLLQFFLTLPPLFSLWKGHLVLPRVLIDFYKFCEPYQIANPYGVFGSLQDYRWEVILEASLDGKEWKNYPFLYKPSSPSSSPPFLFPGFWPRLDWMLWLVGVRGKSQYDAVMKIGNSQWIRPPAWYQSFLNKLMLGEASVMSLMGKNPFDSPPVYLRTSLREYNFAPLGGRDWWTEKEIVIAGAFCRGPKGWKAPITPGFPKQSHEGCKHYQLSTMTKM